MYRRKLTTICAALTISVMGALIADIPPAQASSSLEPSVPQTGVVTDRDPDRISLGTGWKRIGVWHEGGSYMRTSTRGAKATWNLGDVQGVYQFHRLLRGDGSHNGRVKWTIYERRAGESNYRKMQEYRPSSQRGRENWWWYKNLTVELDGHVRITAENITGTIAVDDVRLKQVDLLEEMKPAAKRLCEAGVIKGLMPWVAIPSSIAAAAVAVYAVGYVAGAGGKAWLSTRGAELLAKAVPGTTAADYAKEQLQDWVVDRVLEYLGRELGRIWDDAVESYQYGCNYFKAGWDYLGVTRGYGSYANDLAPLWGARRT